MFQSSPRADNGAGRGGAAQKSLALLSGAVGVGMSILLTPPLFNVTRGPLHVYLAETWGDGLATFLTYVMAGVEAIGLYALTRLVIVLVTTLAAAWIASRR